MPLCMFDQYGKCYMGNSCFYDHVDILRTIQTDLTEAIYGNIYIFSTYGPFFNKPTLPEYIDDLSFEEVHWLYYDGLREKNMQKIYDVTSQLCERKKDARSARYWLQFDIDTFLCIELYNSPSELFCEPLHTLPFAELIKMNKNASPFRKQSTTSDIDRLNRGVRTLFEENSSYSPEQSTNLASNHDLNSSASTSNNSIESHKQILIGVLCKAGIEPSLNEEELQICKGHLMRAILSAGPIANALGYEIIDGLLVIKCSSERNFGWIKSLVEQFPAVGISKMVFTRISKVVGWVLDTQMKIVDILTCFEAQNPGINTKLWKVISNQTELNKDNKSGLKLVILMDQDSVDMLTFKYKNKLSMFLGIVEFSIEPN